MGLLSPSALKAGGEPKAQAMLRMDAIRLTSAVTPSTVVRFEGVSSVSNAGGRCCASLARLPSLWLFEAWIQQEYLLPQQRE